jgi:hypothetical protein
LLSDWSEEDRSLLSHPPRIAVFVAFSNRDAVARAKWPACLLCGEKKQKQFLAQINWTSHGAFARQSITRHTQNCICGCIQLTQYNTSPAANIGCECNQFLLRHKWLTNHRLGQRSCVCRQHSLAEPPKHKLFTTHFLFDIYFLKVVVCCRERSAGGINGGDDDRQEKKSEEMEERLVEQSNAN